MSALSGSDRQWLDAAARLARTAAGATPGRPPAAALLIDASRQLLLGRGITGRVANYAEPFAIDEARGTGRGQTLYTTLEPTSLWGRTPPATDAIIKGGIARVVIGALQTDPAQAGQGVARLREAGIEVLSVDHPPSAALYAADRLSHREGRPFVTGKLIVSRDGMIGRPDMRAALPGSEATQRYVQMLRATTDAVMIGARAARIDDPKLFLRLKSFESRIYQRILVIGAEPLDAGLNLVAGVSGYPTAVVSTSAQLQDVPDAVDQIVVDGRNDRPDLRRLMAALIARGIVNLLVEGGARLIEAILAAELMDRFHLIESDSVIGRGGIPATPLGSLAGRLRAVGLVEVDQRALGPDKLRTFERE